MNILNIKNKIKKNVGITHKFIYKGVRNQNEIFSGTIVNCYNAIFIILTDDNKYKSFSYSDVIMGNLIING